MITKKGKQLMVKNHANYNIVTGTVDNKNPKALYVSISAWADPLNEGIINYGSVIKKLTKRIKKELHDNLDLELFNPERSIIDFDMRESGITYGKRSYMNCEITLYQKHGFKLQEKEIQKSLNQILGDIICNVFDNQIFFDYYKGKN
tara:strand:+ start:216 stop:656 length:441 start_codon:yes stop_codon:yes gene_type:complete